MGAVPPLLLIGTAIIGLGDLLHIIGLGTTHWLESSGRNYGLFRGCLNNGQCSEILLKTSEWEAVQAMTIIGMLAGLAGGAAILVFIFLKLISKAAPRLITLFCTAACFGAFLLIMIGVIIFGAKVYDDLKEYYDLGYSFGLSIVGAILLAAGGAVVFIGGKSID